jgi:AcrR family transcriptional regulator
MPETTNVKTRILSAAYEEIALHGVLGFRLMDVAHGSQCAMSLIHRHFGGRNGLITAVFEMVISANVKRIASATEQLRTNPNFSMNDALLLLYRPSSQEGKTFRWFRIQSLAASVSDPHLRALMVESTTAIHRELKELVIAIRAQQGLRPEIDVDAAAQLWSTLGLMLITDDLLTVGKLSDERFINQMIRIVMND